MVATVLEELYPLVDELVVVDDGSTDGTRCEIERWMALGRPRCRLLLHETNRGMSEAYHTALTELRAGVPYPVGAIGLVRAELGAPAARALALRAHLVEPDEALRLGLVDELVGPAEVLERACDVAREMAAFGGDSYARTKRELRGETLRRIEQAVEAGDPLLDAWLDDESPRAAASVLRKGRDL